MRFIRYPIRLYGDPALRTTARAVADLGAPLAVPGFAPARLPDLARQMLDTMYEAGGVGLAAPQLGLPARLFVAAEYDDDEREGRPLRSRVLREFVMVNPELEVLDARLEARYEDGCLSIPGIYEAGVPRARAVRLRYHDEHGQPQVTEADDYLARVFQHEYEHLDGKLFLDRLPPPVVDRHRVYLAQLQRQARAYLKQLKQFERQAVD